MTGGGGTTFAATDAESSANSKGIPRLALFSLNFSSERGEIFRSFKRMRIGWWRNVKEYGLWSHSQISSLVSSVPFPPQHIMKGTLRSTTARHCTHFFIKLAQSEGTEK